MSRLIGIALMVLILYGLLVGNYETARTLPNHLDLARRLGFYGILTIGVGVLIISGGIDLSIGSLVGLSAVTFGVLVQGGTPAATAALVVVAGSAALGVFHGLLVTKVGLQPFLATLCGLFIYRGFAKTVAGGTTAGLRLNPTLPRAAELQEKVTWLADTLVRGTPLGIPNVLLVMIILAALAALVVHGTVYGRYLYAVGSNEQAARYAGIATDRVKIAAYVFTAAVSGLGGVLYLMEYNTANASTTGGYFELYAITGAVLGGCGLKGGEGMVPGMILGAAVLPLLSKLCNFTPRIGSDQEFTVIGGGAVGRGGSQRIDPTVDADGTVSKLVRP